jgi:hypothetical protein
MTVEKKVVDWELIERHYRAGVMTNVQIATECGVTEGAIRKHAKKHEWTKDLKAKIKARAEDLVRRAEVRAVGTSKTELTPESEKQTVEVNAQATAMVLIVQKGSIKRMHSVFKSLMDELELTTDNRELFAQLGELMDETGENASGKVVQDKLNEIYRKVTGMTGRVDSAKKLAEILEKVVKMEREAFGIDDSEKLASPIDQLLLKIANERR